MRLTLRTLLAYMDDILESEDSQDLAKKIQESERASQLLHRIRDVAQRLRLSAPEVMESGAGLDPNTVAEYLDNTLPPDRVVDFEKVCLDSDIHLAEVASCHQILTLVLGEPAEVDPEGRQRIYEIPKLAAASAVQEETPASQKQDVQQPTAPTEQTVAEQQPNIAVSTPRTEPKRKPRWVRDVAVAAGTAVTVVIILVLTGQLEHGTHLANLMARLRNSSSPVSGQEETPPLATQATGQAAAPGKKVPATGVRQPDGMAEPAAPSAEAAAPAPVAPLPPGAAATDTAASPVSPPAKLNAVPGAAPSPTPTTTAPAAEPAPKAPKMESVTNETPSPANEKPEGQTPAAAPETPVQPPEAKVAGTPPAGTPPVTMPAAGEPAPAKQGPVGQYISTSEVLVQLNPKTAAWERLPAQALLSAGDDVLSFPTYRPVIVINNDISLQLFDGTRVAFKAADAQGDVGLGIQFGRLVLTAKKENARLWLQIGDRVGKVQFAGPGSEIRLDVRRPSDADSDPETKPTEPVATCYVTNGKVSWQEKAGQESLAITAPGKFRWQASPPNKDATPEPAAPSDPAATAEDASKNAEPEKPPAWDAPDAISSLDRRASAAVELSLRGNRPVVLGLRELADRRQREVRWLAMRCLAYVGDFEPMAIALNDPEQKLFWQEYIDQLREALTRGPESATAVHATLETLYRDDGDSLYTLLWKYRKKELNPQDAAQLLEWLDSEPLAIRVLSFCNLQEIKGLKLYYRPEYPAAKRLPLVQKWRERLDLGPPSSPGPGPSRPTGGAAPPTPATPAVPATPE